jgi:branched-chain amino acid transport system ATP-binding protein/branched-chain amino acid transport system permease protein
VAASTSTLKTQRRAVPSLAAFIAWCLVLLFLPHLLPVYLVDVMAKVLIMGIFAMSLDVLLGYTGLFSLGHAAFLGLGSYTVGMLVVRYGVGSLWIGLVAGVVVAVIAGAAFGVVALRVRGAYFLLVTFALGQLLVSLGRTWSFLSPAGSGSQGIFGIALPTVGLPSLSTLTLQGLYYLAAVSLTVSFVVLRRFLSTPVGYALQGVREGEARMRALGYNTWIAQFAAYIVAAAFAGLAGVLLAYHDGIAAPDSFGVELSTLVMLMVLIGGAGTLYGPVIGATLLVLTEYYASTYLTERWPLILGGLFVATVMFTRGGIASLLADVRLRFRKLRPMERLLGKAVAGRDDSSAADVVLSGATTKHPSRIEADATASVTTPGTPSTARRLTGARLSKSTSVVLAVENVSKHFDGVVAVKDVSLSVPEGERLAIIGTNGAGKSTLFNLITGEVAPSQGRVSFFGTDITTLPVHRRAQLGIARSFQVTTLFPKLSVFRSTWLAIQGVQAWRWQMVRRATSHLDAFDLARALLIEWDLWDVRDEPVQDISYGEQRRLEVVMALAAEPRLLLMDEPTSGQTMEESQSLANHLLALPRDTTLIVIAHDMDLVFRMADRIVVMHQGRIVAEGTGAEIQANKLVQESYMGSTSVSRA